MSGTYVNPAFANFTVSAQYGNDHFGQRTPLNTLMATATAATTGVVDLTTIVRFGMRFGLLFQATAGGITPSLTLSRIENAMAGNATWFAQSVLTSGNITVIAIPAVAVQLVFSGAGSVIIGAL